MQVKPGGQRRKGHSWEREIARLLRPLFGDGVKRGFQTRGGGKEAPDVDGTPYHIEAKHGRLVNLRAALAQAIRDTDGRVPIVIAKDDRTEPVVVMRFADWLRMEEERLPKEVVNELRGDPAEIMKACWGSAAQTHGGKVVDDELAD
jgi:hypothetical protein